MALNDPNAWWNIIGQAAKQSFLSPWQSLQNSGWFSASDFIAPGSTALNRMFDFNGQRAAAQQASNQMSLDNAAREFAASEAQKQRDWEEMMSNTAIQRQAADYRAAGLNPWLAVQRGASGAAVPQGSSAQSSSGNAAKADNKLAIAAGIFATALRMFLTKGK